MRSGDNINRRLMLADAHGLAWLALDGARIITDVVEAVHAAILERIGIPLAPFVTWSGSRTGAIPGFVYRSIHAGYDMAETGLTAASGFLRPAPAEAAVPLREREHFLAVLNGVWGDHLAATGNPLAIDMSFRVVGVPLALERASLQAAFPRPSGRLLILLHGLCMNDLNFVQDVGNDEVHDHGAALAAELGYTPLYLHYNTGLHVSTNGKRFGELLEKLVAEWPVPVEELVVVGHSMGGLVARSAAYYGTEQGQAWRGKLRRMVCLGTPHHGSGLERLGHRLDELFDVTSYSAPLQRLGASRSAGITDLRHGNVLDEDWEGLPHLGHHHDTRCPAPLPEDVQCYALAATMGTRAGDARDRLLGDGFVPLESGLGLHPDPTRRMAFPEAHQWTVYGVRHNDLLCNCEVYDKLRDWLTD